MVKNKLKIIYLIGSIEFFVAAIFILNINHSTEQGGLFGYSFHRLLLVTLTLVIAIFLLFLPKSKIEKYELIIKEAFQEKYLVWSYISISLFIMGLLIWLTPKSNIGYFRYYFERLRPLVTALCILPFQINFKLIFNNKIRIDKNLLRSPILVFVFLLFIFVFISISKFGISPDLYYWNVAGIPLTSFQFIILFYISFNVFCLISIFQKPQNNKKIPKVDIILMIILYFGTILIWFNTPMVKHYFSIEPTPPYNQPFPYSDARTLDLGAISIINGWGINFGGSIDKPLYIGILSIFHTFSPNNYSIITLIQISLLALIVPIMYLLGKLFRNRFLGIFISLIVMIKLRNAILLSHIVASVNPKLYVTEVFTLLGLLCISILLFVWVNKKDNKTWLSLIVGCVLGITTLIRMNPVILLPAISLFMFFVMWKNRKAWIFQNFIFLVSFIAIISPWLITGRYIDGTPYYFFKFTEIIKFRYSQTNLDTNLDSSFSELDKSKVGNENKDKIIYKYSYYSNSDIKIFDINSFPGFVINHTLHNIIGSFLILPDTLTREDQNILNLVKRPYWQENQTGIWKGELGTGQQYVIFLNLIIVSFGLYWSWKFWKWGGVIPIMIFLAYCLSLGFARNSGSRYLVPIDWIIYFYYILGIMYIFNIVFKDIFNNWKGESIISSETRISTKLLNKIIIIVSTISIIISFLIIPFTNKFIKLDSPLCGSNINPDDYYQIETGVLSDDIIFQSGQILYPEFSNDGINAILLTCKQFKKIVFNPNNHFYQHGDFVIIGFNPNDSSGRIEFIIPLNNLVSN